MARQHSGLELRDTLSGWVSGAVMGTDPPVTHSHTPHADTESSRDSSPHTHNHRRPAGADPVAHSNAALAQVGPAEAGGSHSTEYSQFEYTFTDALSLPRRNFGAAIVSGELSSPRECLAALPCVPNTRI